MKYAHRNIITLKWQQIRSDRQRDMWLVSLFPFLNIYIKEKKNSYFFQINPCACCLQHHLFDPRHTETSVTPRGGGGGGHRWHRGVTGEASGADVAKKRRKKNSILMIFVSFFCMDGVGGRCDWFSPMTPPPPPPPHDPPSWLPRFVIYSFLFFLSFCLLLKVGLNTGLSSNQGSNQRNQTTCASAHRNSTKKTNQRNH